METAQAEVYGVVPRGKPLARAVWTSSRELAEDMVRHPATGEAMELWVASRLRPD